MIAIIDYGAGNLRSVQKACEYIGADAIITSDKDKIKSAQRVILPGVGAFGDCMESIREHNLFDTIHQVCESGTPFLGICLGLQHQLESICNPERKVSIILYDNYNRKYELKTGFPIGVFKE